MKHGVRCARPLDRCRPQLIRRTNPVAELSRSLRLLVCAARPGAAKASVLSSAFILTEQLRSWVATPNECQWPVLGRAVVSEPSARLPNVKRLATFVMVVAAVINFAGCASAPAGGGRHAIKTTGVSPVNGAVAAGSLAVGPGPTTYTVQRQPAPGSCQYRYSPTGEPLPDPRCTPGAINPKVIEDRDPDKDTLAHTVCRSGYTKSIRPPVAVTRVEKRANAESYSYTGDLADAEYDHLVSLVLGGDPNDPRNLWVEPPSPGHRPKDGVNNPKDIV